jgi:glutamate-1-semialdehyde aminotransferase
MGNLNADQDLSPRASRCNCSEALLERARRCTMSDRIDLEGTYPFVIAGGKGAYVWDLDGRRFIDFTAATGAILLGYRHSEVDDALVAQIRDSGTLLPTTISRVQVELAERLIEVFPCAERALFFRTGSCATTAAVRLARVFTGKPVVLTSGYHGWHDWHLHIFPRFDIRDDRSIDFRYNLNLLEELLATHSGLVACVIITPEPNFFDAAYFRELEQIVRRNQVLLIFDEMISGFRYAIGGFQAYCGVIPDLATVGKGLANGYALSAVLGRADVMAARDRTHLAGTFNHDQGPMAAAVASLKVVERDGVLSHLNLVGAQLRDGLNALFDRYSIAAAAVRFPGLFHIIFEQERIAQEFYRALYQRGVLMHPFDAQMVTAAHTFEDIQVVLGRVDEVLVELRRRHGDRVAPNAGVSAPDRFAPCLSRRAIDYRTLHEFGGLIDYRQPIDEVPRCWEQHDR